MILASSARSTARNGMRPASAAFLLVWGGVALIGAAQARIAVAEDWPASEEAVIQHATELARNMVMRFGMSDAVGPVAVGDREHQVFLGREFAQHREVSDKTAELVDTEVKRVLDEAYSRARDILQRDVDMLHRMAKALLDRETLDRTDVELVVEGKELPALDEASGKGLDSLLPQPRSKEKSASDGSGVLGTPPAEPAGA